MRLREDTLRFEKCINFHTFLALMKENLLKLDFIKLTVQVFILSIFDIVSVVTLIHNLHNFPFLSLNMHFENGYCLLKHNKC